MTVRILLDTHIALWAVAGDSRLAPEASAAILSAADVFVSVASLWEIAIKRSLSKRDMPVSSSQARQAFDDADYTLLDIRAEHVRHVETLPPIHQDPFDRLLVAQALAEPMTLITRDIDIGKYSSAILCVP